MKNIKKYRGLIILIMAFLFSMYVNAVFEGRNEQIKEYAGVRQQVEMQEYSSQKATGIPLEDPTEKEGTGYEAPAPFADSSLIVLVFCSLITGAYYLGRKKGVKIAMKN